MESEPITLSIRVMDGDNFIVTCHLEDTVEMLKQKVESVTCIPVSSQRLIFQGRVLRNEQTLQDCRISNNCAVFLIRQSNPPPEQPTPAPEPVPPVNPMPTPTPNPQNIVNPILQSISSAIGSMMQGIGGNAQVQVSTAGQMGQMGPFVVSSGGNMTFSPMPNITPAPNTTSSTAPSTDDILDEVLNSTSVGASEAVIEPTEDERAERAQQPAPQQQQPTTQTTQASSVMESVLENTRNLLLQNNHDPTAAAVAAYIANLQQTAQYLQRKLHETNFNANAWGDVQQALQQHVILTQNIARLPAPAMNRGEPASVSVVATSIPIRGGMPSNDFIQQALMQHLQQSGGRQPPSSSRSQNNSNGNNPGNGSASDDYNGMYM